MSPHRTEVTEVTCPAGAGTPRSAAVPSRRFLLRATLVTAALTVAGALLGLARDRTLARLFGAGPDTDAFLVAWTVPEVAATLLVEDGMAFVLVPAFSRALARGGTATAPDPVRALVAASLPRLLLVLGAAAALTAAGAPLLVGLLAPGLPESGAAVDCMRLTATCALSFGLAGYASAALRAHRSFVPPAAIYVAYNLAIIAAMTALGGRLGVRAAAVGVAAGGCLMVAVQAPALWRRLRRGDQPARPGRSAQPVQRWQPGRPHERRGIESALVATVVLFALCRQSQVLIERYLAASLPPGAISHLNYAQKVAQLPMALSLMLCAVTFPVVARALAEGDAEQAGRRAERDLTVASGVVLSGTAALVACAPAVLEVLFQNGAYTVRDTAATAAVLRVYALGLLGQTVVGVLARAYFSAARRTWYPLGAMAAGAVSTAVVGAWAAGTWGAAGIAAANAVGISVTALLLLHGANGRRGGALVSVRASRVLRVIAAQVAAAVSACGAGLAVARRADGAVASVLVSGTAVGIVFVLVLGALHPGARTTALRAVRRAPPPVAAVSASPAPTRKRSHAP